MRDVLKKRVGDYDIGRTLGEVRPRLSCPHKAWRFVIRCLCTFSLDAGHICQGKIWGAQGHWRGCGNQGQGRSTSSHCRLCLTFSTCMHQVASLVQLTGNHLTYVCMLGVLH